MRRFRRELSLYVLAATLVVGVIHSCAADNVAADRAKRSDEQRAKELMNKGDYDGAIAILEPLVEVQPDVHSRKRLLAAAYAGKVGVSILAIVSQQFSGGDEDGGDSIFDQLDRFLPSDYGLAEVEILDLAVTVLNSIPAELRGSEGDPDYGESAEFQLSLYQTLYATM